jgi:hypothetical protein
VGVQPAGIGNYPDTAAEEPVSLLAGTGIWVGEGGAVSGEPSDSDYYRLMLGDECLQPGTSRPQLGGGELIGSGGRAIHQIGDPNTPPHQVGAVLVGHGLTPIEITIDDAGQSQRWIKAVAGMCEVCLRCRRPQARIDPDKEQFQSWTEQIRNRRIPERLQLGLSKAHNGHRSSAEPPIALPP